MRSSIVDIERDKQYNLDTFYIFRILDDSSCLFYSHLTITNERRIGILYSNLDFISVCIDLRCPATIRYGVLCS